MLDNTKLCELRLNARQVLLTWARARRYKDRAVECSKLAHLAPDRNVRNRYIAIARHFRALAEIKRRVADETNQHIQQSLNIFNHSNSVPFAAFLLRSTILGATITVSFDLAHANDCLTAPNSPAPKGSHWHYHLNQTTQQKCWYVRRSENRTQHATALKSSTNPKTLSTTGGLGRSNADDEIKGAPRQIEDSTKGIGDTASNRTPDATSQVASQRSPELAASMSPAAPLTAVVWPDPPQVAPAVTEREADPIAADTAPDPALDHEERASSIGQRTSKFEIPIALFPCLAIALVMVGFAKRLIRRRPGAHHAQTNNSVQSGHDAFDNRADDSSIVKQFDFQSFVEAVSDLRTPEATRDIQVDEAISTHEARLSQLRENIDRMLQSRLPVEALPLRSLVDLEESQRKSLVPNALLQAAS